MRGAAAGSLIQQLTIKSHQNELKEGALIHFNEVSVPSLDLLFSFGRLVVCFFLSINVVLAVLNDLR